MAGNEDEEDSENGDAEFELKSEQTQTIESEETVTHLEGKNVYR